MVAATSWRPLGLKLLFVRSSPGRVLGRLNFQPILVAIYREVSVDRNTATETQTLK